MSQSSTMSSISLSANQDICACSTPPNVAISTATPIAAPSCRAVLRIPDASPTSGPATAPIAPTLSAGKPMPIPTPIISRPGRMRMYAHASSAVEGRNETHSIPIAITISAGRAISPGGLMSAKRAANGHASSPISGTGTSAAAASIGS
ncbi:MAG: hypothetical protein QOI45_2569 [Thermoleophilaceae bacterium]|nr:hypothetical protein [Thermoleophilaceae bacterium]